MISDIILIMTMVIFFLTTTLLITLIVSDDEEMFKLFDEVKYIIVALSSLVFIIIYML